MRLRPYGISRYTPKCLSTALRQGSYRALASTANHFAREVHIDEITRSLKMDPLEFRLKNLKDERQRAVLEAAAKAFGWGGSKPAANHGFGIAGGFEKGGYVANCAEVAVDRASGKVKIIITIFNRATPVEMEYWQVQPI